MKTLYMGLPGPELLTHGLSPCVTRLSTIQDAFRTCYGKRTLAIGSPFKPLEIFVRMSRTVTV